jgi:hypothetical protein
MTPRKHPVPDRGILALASWNHHTGEFHYHLRGEEMRREDERREDERRLEKRT